MSADEKLSALNDRFDRFESSVLNKLDVLTEAMIKLARTEEKLIAIENDRANQVQRLNRLSEKIDTIDKNVDDNARTVNTINKLFWIVATSAIGVIVAAVFNVGPF